MVPMALNTVTSRQARILSPALSARILGLALLVAGLGGCSLVHVSEDPYFDREFFALSAPRSIAIAPFENESNYEGAAEAMRIRVYGALAPMPYQDIELDYVDETLRRKALLLDRPVDELQPHEIAEPGLADAVVFGRVEKVSRLFLFFYSSIRIDLHVTMVDTATQKKLYHNGLVFRDMQFTVPTNPVSAVSGMISSIWNMRGAKLDRSLNETALELANRFPVPDRIGEMGERLIASELTGPVPFEVDAWRPAPSSSGIALVLGPGGGSVDETEGLAARFQVIQSFEATDAPRFIGSTRDLEFVDESARLGPIAQLGKPRSPDPDPDLP